MRTLNRALLTAFFIELPDLSLKEACLRFSEVEEVDEAMIEQKWADECIDEEVKPLL